MSSHRPAVIRCHDDSPLFVRALRFTAAETGFPARLIEKDYFGSLVLEHLTRADDSLVFKGGTCLTKVYAGFYRLSEDLDFVIPMSVEATRQERSRRAAGMKQAVSKLPRALPDILGVRPNDTELVTLVQAKLTVPGNEPVNVSAERLVSLRQQLAPQLKPVLRERDFREFDLDRAFGIVTEMANCLWAPGEPGVRPPPAG